MPLSSGIFKFTSKKWNIFPYNVIYIILDNNRGRTNIMKSQTIKNDKYIAVTMYRRREREEKLKSQIAAFLFCMLMSCGILYLIISSIPY